MSKFAALAVAVDRPARMTILHPTTGQPIYVLGANGKPTAEFAWIDVYSTDSDIFRAHERAASNRRMRSRARRLTAEDIEAETVETYVVLTAGWRLVGLNGVPSDVPFTPENARELYGANELAFIRRQVDAFSADLGNFPAAAATTTSPT